MAAAAMVAAATAGAMEVGLVAAAKEAVMAGVAPVAGSEAAGWAAGSEARGTCERATTSKRAGQRRGLKLGEGFKLAPSTHVHVLTWYESPMLIGVLEVLRKQRYGPPPVTRWIEKPRHSEFCLHLAQHS